MKNSVVHNDEEHILDDDDGCSRLQRIQRRVWDYGNYGDAQLAVVLDLLKESNIHARLGTAHTDSLPIFDCNLKRDKARSVHLSKDKGCRNCYWRGCSDKTCCSAYVVKVAGDTEKSW